MTRALAIATALLGLVLARFAEAAPLPSWLTVAPDLTHADIGDWRISDTRQQLLRDEGHGVVVELWRREIQLEKNGDVVDRTTEVRRFLSEQGVQSAGDFAFPVSPSLSTAVIEAAYSVTPEGRRIPIEKATIQVVNPSTVPIFRDIHWVVAPLRAISSGSRAVFVNSVTSQTDRLPIAWGTYSGTAASAPIERFELIVDWADGVDAPQLATDDPAVQCTRNGRRWTCVRTESPAFVSDPTLSNPLDFISQVAVGEGRDWSQLSDSVRAIVDGRLGDTRSLKPVAEQLIADRASHRERVEAIHRFVADKIRYVALLEGESAIVPNPPQVTLDRRFGDCKDKATLFIGLARAAGLEAYPVLIATSRKRADKFIIPTGAYFDHMIVCVRGEDGACIFVDPTVAFSPIGVLAPQLQGAVMLDTADTDPQPRQIEEARFVWNVSVNEDNEVGCDGSVTHRAHIRFTDAGALAMRAVYGPLSIRERARTFTSFCRDTLGMTGTLTATFADVDQPGPAVTIDVEHRVAGNVDLTDFRSYGDRAYWLMMAALLARVAEWPHDVQQPGVRFVSHTTYKICPKLAVRTDGAELDFKAPLGSLVRSYSAAAKEIEAETTLELPRAELSPEEVRKFMRLVTVLVEQSNIQFGLVAVGR